MKNFKKNNIFSYLDSQKPLHLRQIVRDLRNLLGLINLNSKNTDGGKY